MVYCQDERLTIRSMEEGDIHPLCAAYNAQGWHDEVSDYLTRLQDQAEGRCIALIALYDNEPAGQVYLYLAAHGGPFRDKGWPIIVDFGVLQKFQRRGIGSRLMDIAEQLAAQHADAVCLGVGLSREYGSAQRMYARRGYIPDGSGVWYRDVQCVQYETLCTVDDDLVLYLSKALHSAPSYN